jgi:hypothetical protein
LIDTSSKPKEQKLEPPKEADASGFTDAEKEEIERAAD